MNTYSDPDSSRPGTSEPTATAGTNSTRRDVAVALAHNRAHDGADAALPRVVASGKGAVARQILEIAFARGIKVREDADLAEVLAAVEIDSEIPMAAFAAVAEILSYVYRAQESAAARTANGAAEAATAATTQDTTGPGDAP